jgi:DNA ligase (NAD+)
MSYNQQEEATLVALTDQLLRQTPPAHESAALEMADQLRQVIKYHEWRYYIKNNAVLGDTEFDKLFALLKNIEQQFDTTVTDDSPTQRVGSDLATDNQHTHLVPMLSLANSYDAQDLIDFDTQVRKLTGRESYEPISYCVEPKFDGGSISLVYQHGELVRAATRGNGVVGEDMTANARVIIGVPHKLKAQPAPKTLEVRGEALIRRDRFEQVNTQREKAGQQPFANPRNAATGGLRTKDPDDTAERLIDAMIYAVGAIDTDKPLFDTHAQSIATLQNLGFQTPADSISICTDIQEVIAHITAWEAQRDTYPYETDGMVVKVNDLHLQQLCGATGHHPRWAIAFKFKARQAITRLVGVDFQVGKTGNMTPVARLEPVALGGVTVSNVSLHNEDFITGKDIRIGDRVVVERAGDVIPYIKQSLPDIRTGDEQPVVFPQYCPSCASPVVKNEGEAAWRCVNTDCPAQAVQRMIFHVSKEAMDIEGLGPALVEKFYELGWVRNMADIYQIDYEAVAGLEGMGRKSAENLKAGIEKAKQQPISRLLNSLSIHQLGKKGSQLLAAEVSHVLDLTQWPLERYQAIHEFGPVLARNVFNYFAKPAHIGQLKRMESLGVNMQQTAEDHPAVANTEGPLAGKTILFTGTLTTMTREQAEKQAAAWGAQIASGVNKRLDILVVGEKAGSKLEKAQKLGTVNILTEAEFSMLGKNGA